MVGAEAIKRDWMLGRRCKMKLMGLLRNNILFSHVAPRCLLQALERFASMRRHDEGLNSGSDGT